MIFLFLIQVSLTLWGTVAEEFDGTTNPIVAVKGARISEFNGGKSLSVMNSSVFQIDPDIPEAHRCALANFLKF